MTQEQLLGPIASRLKLARQKKGLPLASVAAASGFSASTISRVESGLLPPSESFVQSLIPTLGLNPDWVYYGKEPMFDDSSPAAISVTDFAQKLEAVSRLEAIIEAQRRLTEEAEELKGFLQFVPKSLASDAGSAQLKITQNLTLGKTGANASAVPEDEFLWIELRKRVLALTLKQRRGAKKQLAEFLGISRQALNEWLHGNRSPRAETALRLLKWAEQAEREQKTPRTVTSSAMGKKAQVRRSREERPNPGRLK